MLDDNELDDGLDFAMHEAPEAFPAPTVVRFADIPDGLHAELDDEIYHQRTLGTVSSTGLKRVARSPMHYRAWCEGEDGEGSDAMAFGKALHYAILEPVRFEGLYCIEQDFGDCRKKENKAKRDAWRSENHRKTPLSTKDGEAIRGIQKAIAAHPLAAPLLRGGISEVAAKWHDEGTGLLCKAKADYWRRDRRLIVDLKTTSDASEAGFAKSVAAYRYHVQAALYSEGFRACGEEIEHFVFIAVEKVAPYAIAVFSLDAEAMETGRILAHREMETIAECLKTGTWPGYPVRITELKLPRWAL